MCSTLRHNIHKELNKVWQGNTNVAGPIGNAVRAVIGSSA